MLLVHAKALAVEFVVRHGQEFPKDGPFTDEQLIAEDWEPIQVSREPVIATSLPPEDCGCGEAVSS